MNTFVFGVKLERLSRRGRGMGRRGSWRREISKCRKPMKKCLVDFPPTPHWSKQIRAGKCGKTVSTRNIWCMRRWRSWRISRQTSSDWAAQFRTSLRPFCTASWSLAHLPDAHSETMKLAISQTTLMRRWRRRCQGADKHSLRHNVDSTPALSRLEPAGATEHRSCVS